MPTLSIIIPVYNAAQYIERCLLSVERQSLRNMEVVIVDDHGHDESISIAKALAAQSERKDIKYIFTATEQNGGPGAARNVGLKTAHGEYIAFLDADDIAEPQMYQMLYDNAKANDADLSYCNAICDDGIVENVSERLVVENVSERSVVENVSERLVVENVSERSVKPRSRQEQTKRADSKVLRNPQVANVEISRQERSYLLRHYVAYLWTYIYSREMLEKYDIMFPDARSSEDSAFIGCCLLLACKVVGIDDALYHYMVYSDSLSHTRKWRGREKRKAFSCLFRKARETGQLRAFFPELIFIYIKKTILSPILEYIK